MTNQANLSISNLLYLALIIGLASLATLAYFGNRNLLNERQSIETVYDAQVAPLLELQSIDSDLEDIRYRLVRVATLETACCWDNYLHLIEAKKRINGSWKRYQDAHKTGSFPAIQDLAKDHDRIALGMERFEQFASELEQAYKNEDFDTVANLQKIAWPTIEQALLFPLKEARPSIQKNITSLYQYLKVDAEQHTQRYWIIALVATLIFALTLGLITLRIRMLLGSLQQDLAKVIQGDLKARVAAPGNDEMGKIGEHTNTLITQLAQYKQRNDKDSGAIRTLQERREKETDLAEKLQTLLNPKLTIPFPGLHGIAGMTTSPSVGGNYYHYYPLHERYLVLMVGDISDKGIVAGLVGAMIKTKCKELAAQAAQDPREILSAINTFLRSQAPENTLMTMFVGVYDNQENIFLYANAGHPFPYWKRASKEEWFTLEVGGPPLGSEKEPNYTSEKITANPGDRLFIYTDGLVEAENAEETPFGYERIEAYLQQHQGPIEHDWLDALFTHIRQYIKEERLKEDLTAVLIEFAASGHWLDQQPAPATATIDKSSKAPSLLTLEESQDQSRPVPPLSPQIDRNLAVFFAKSPLTKTLPTLASNGVRRVLMKQDPLLQRLGMEQLLSQHAVSKQPDLARLLPSASERQEWVINDSESKLFIIQETEAWINDRMKLSDELAGFIPLLLDELIENALYAAPRNHHNKPLYPKGTQRELDRDEEVRIRIALEPNAALGITVEDDWGTLIPHIFLQRITENLEGEGLVSGEGGAGLYLVWRMSDYLQIRVTPFLKTEVSILLDLTREANMERESGFQFLYHT